MAAVFAAVVVWFGVLLGIRQWLRASTPTPALRERPPVEMRLVELAPPTAPSAPPLAHALPAAVAPAGTAPASNKPAKPDMPHAAHALVQHVAPKLPDRPAEQKTTPVTTSAAQPQAIADAKPATDPSAQTASPTSSETQHAAAATGTSTGDTAARAIAQPLPELPDDLREQAYRTVATARFTIHADGSVDVELVKATPNPRLNQLLLEVLRKWRFSPAMQAGRPVESKQDIRVHFNVD